MENRARVTPERLSRELRAAIPTDRGEILIGVQLTAKLNAVGRPLRQFGLVLLSLFPIGGLHALRAVRKREARGQPPFGDQLRFV